MNEYHYHFTVTRDPTKHCVEGVESSPDKTILKYNQSYLSRISYYNDKSIIETVSILDQLNNCRKQCGILAAENWPDCPDIVKLYLNSNQEDLRQEALEEMYRIRKHTDYRFISDIPLWSMNLICAILDVTKFCMEDIIEERAKLYYVINNPENNKEVRADLSEVKRAKEELNDATKNLFKLSESDTFRYFNHSFSSPFHMLSWNGDFSPYEAFKKREGPYIHRMSVSNDPGEDIVIETRSSFAIKDDFARQCAQNVLKISEVDNKSVHDYLSGDGSVRGKAAREMAYRIQDLPPILKTAKDHAIMAIYTSIAATNCAYVVCRRVVDALRIEKGLPYWPVDTEDSLEHSKLFNNIMMEAFK